MLAMWRTISAPPGMPTPKLCGASAPPTSGDRSLDTHFPRSRSQTSPTAIGLSDKFGFRRATIRDRVQGFGSPKFPSNMRLKTRPIWIRISVSGPSATTLISSNVHGDMAAADKFGRVAVALVSFSSEIRWGIVLSSASGRMRSNSPAAG